MQFQLLKMQTQYIVNLRKEIKITKPVKHVIYNSKHCPNKANEKHHTRSEKHHTDEKTHIHHPGKFCMDIQVRMP